MSVFGMTYVSGRRGDRSGQFTKKSHVVLSLYKQPSSPFSTTAICCRARRESSSYVNIIVNPLHG